MERLFSFHVLLPLLAAGVLSVVASAGFRQRRVPGALAFAVAMSLGVVWDVTYAVEVAATTLRAKVFAQQVRFFALPWLVPALFWMVLEYTGKTGWLTRPRVVALSIIPAVSSVLGATMPYHQLFRYNFRLSPYIVPSVLEFDVGPFFWVYVHFCNVVIGAILVALGSSIPGTPFVYRVRTVLLMVSVLLPGGVNALFMQGITPVPHYNLAPSLTAVTGLLLLWGVFRLRLMELVPIARTAVVDNLADLIFVLDIDGRVVDINQSALGALGLTRRDVVGRLAQEVFRPYPSLWQFLEESADTDIRKEVEIARGGGKVVFEAQVSRIRDPAGWILGRVAVLHEVTELLRARESAEAADRAKTVFLANISHEIRAPINVILGFVQLLKRDPALSPESREYLSLIEASGEHLRLLLDDTLDLTSIEAGRVVLEPVACDLHALVRGVESILRHQFEEKGIRFEVSVAPDVPRHVHADARRIRQILLNLLSNALKFTPSGKVSLDVSALTGSEEGTARWIRFAVQDTGVGIAPGEMASLFTPFAQGAGGRTIREGAGLGLALSRELARLMGGDIQVTSELGVGSTFFLDLPLVVLPSAPAAPPGEVWVPDVVRLAPGQEQRRVLVVDDHGANRRLLVALLQALNPPSPEPPVLEVREAGSLTEALALLSSWRPDLIFVDMRLPDGSGCDLARAAREQFQGVPLSIVGLSASVLQEDRTALLEAGCDAFIAKPYREDDLLATLVRNLDLRFVAQRLSGGTS